MAVTIFEKPVGTEIATLESNVVFKRKSPYYGSLKTISNCLLVDTGNMNGANNDAGIVTNSSQYAPTDLVTGIREVFWISSSNIAIKINGISSTGWYKEWFRHYNGSTWTAWNEFALNSNFSIVETNVIPVSGMSFNRTRIQKYGRLCTFTINATVTSGSRWVTIATIPAEVKPIDTFQSIIVNDSTSAAIEARVTADGYVQLWNAPNDAVWGGIWWFC